MRLTSTLILCWLFLVIAACAQDTKSALTPNEVYTRAWKLIENEYYDAEFNGQDWHKWEHRYDGKLKTLDDANSAIATMLASLGDPKTRFRLRADLNDYSANGHGKHLGYGMNLWHDRNNKIKITNVTDGTPAFKAGIHAGDEIIAVNGKPIKSLNSEEIKKQIDGPTNTKIALTIKNGAAVRTLSLSKAVLALKSVATVTILSGNLGYIGIDNLGSDNATEELRGAVQRLRYCYGLILDLRKNPGGLPSNAFSMAAMFLTTRQRIGNGIGRNDNTIVLVPAKRVTTQPLVVLIDSGTAESAEIFTAALQDNRRATVIGERSYGHSAGMVQQITRFDDGSEIIVSTTRLLTPKGEVFGNKGISPDIQVVVNSQDRSEGKGQWWLETPKLDPNDLKDIQLLRAISFLHDAASAEITSQEKHPDGWTQSQQTVPEEPRKSELHL